MPAVLAPLLPSILTALGGLVVAGLGYLTTIVQKKMKADSAWTKLANIGISLAGKAWDHLGPVVQQALADGKITAEERAAIEKVVQDLVEEDTSKGALEEIAKAVGLPFAGIIARLAADFIDTWTAAHDPANTSVSRLAYPTPAMVEFSDNG